MSKSIIIQENGTSKTISVDKLRVKLANSGSGTWSPKESTKIAPIIVRANGTYKAKDLGIYGISKVVVNTESTSTTTVLRATRKGETIVSDISSVKGKRGVSYKWYSGSDATHVTTVISGQESTSLKITSALVDKYVKVIATDADHVNYSLPIFRDCEITGSAKVGEIKAVNIAIAEGEIARLFSAHTITTKLSGGGKCEWVPDSSVDTKSKSIKKNGTYEPKDDKCYGYSQVYVSVPHKSDGSDQYPYKPDDPYVPSDPSHPDAPAYIKVTKEPDNTTYVTGDTIDYTGIECTMYSLDGSVFTDAEHPDGVLVESELTFPITEAPEPEETIPDLNEG